MVVLAIQCMKALGVIGSHAMCVQKMPWEPGDGACFELEPKIGLFLVLIRRFGTDRMGCE
jgi:hypothetical protein